MFRQSGFTLVEVIIALLVAGLSLTSLFMVYHIGTNNSARAIEAQRADMLAASYAEELLLDGALPEAHRLAGVCGQGKDPVIEFSDQPPLVFGSDYTGANDIYRQYQVDIVLQCLPGDASFSAAAGKISLTIHSASGERYDYVLFRGGV
jgi:prepilin-type N-terminal cleavage/methylation domain-containing protein